MTAHLDAAAIGRGTARLLAALDFVVLAEFPLANGRRADLFALGHDGTCVIVEIKSSLADYRADRKWREYLPYADRFYFAVASGFPHHLLPTDEGLVLADRFEGTILREARSRPLAAARRRVLTLRFARLAASRLAALTDPPPG